jgi:3'-5' exoribonuclease
MDGDLALAGAILHDVGKIQELGGTSRGRTTKGRLVGHLVLGMQIVVQAAHELGLADRPWLRELEHILLSHHGDMQFGSPVRPLTREALVVHFMDNLDSKLKIMGEALPEADDTGFTPYNKWLEGRAYVGARSRIEEDVDAGT